MNRIGARLAGALVALLLAGAGVLWLAQNYEWVPETHRTPPVASVAADPWTAFVRGLEPRGAVSRYETLDDLDWDDVGLLVARWADVEGDDPQDWLSWVQDGGRLVVVFDPDDDWSGPWTEMDLLAPLEQGPPPGDPGSTELRVRAGADSPPVTAAPNLWWKGGHADVSFGRPGEPGAALLAWNLGEGWLLLSGPLKALDNEGLADEGNRRFADALVGGLEPRQVWIPAAPAGAKTPVAGGNQAGPFWFSLAVLLGLLLWSQGPRLGPVLFSDQGPRLGLAERLLAEGRFLWGRRHGKDLLARLPGADPPPARLSRIQFIQAVTRWVQANARPSRKTHDD